MAEPSPYDALSQASPNLSGISPITAPSFPATEISSLNMGSVQQQFEPLGYRAMASILQPSRQSSPARSIESSIAGSNSSGAARARAQRHRDRAAQLDRQAEEEEERELFELGVVEDVESFERHSAAAQQPPVPTMDPRSFGPFPQAAGPSIPQAAEPRTSQAVELTAATQQQIDDVAAVILARQLEINAGEESL